MISGVCVCPCFPFHLFPEGCPHSLCFASCYKGAGYCYKYGTKWPCLVMTDSGLFRLFGYSFDYCYVAQEHSSLHNCSTSLYLKRHGWLWIGHAR
jgi:hypothetical protein